MAKVNDIMGNVRNVVDNAITISIERYNELIIKEALFDVEHRKNNIKESEEK